MKRKTLLILLTSFMIAVCSAMIFTACRAKRDDSDHHFGEWVTETSATCTESGEKYRVCTDKGCNEKETEIIPALGHDIQSHDAKTPTCTEVGWDAYDTCSRCDYTTKVELPVDPTNHSLVHRDGKQATCFVKGWEAYDICTRCTYTTYTEIPALLAHHYVSGYCEWCSEPEPTLDNLIFTLKSDDTYEVKRANTSVKTVVIPSLYNQKYVTSIAASGFSRCTSLTSVIIPDSVVSIGEEAFYFSSKLAGVTLGNGVITIGDSAFTGCDALMGITIPDSVKTIGASAFYGCNALKSVTLAEGLTSIGSKAFYDCDALESITIPNSVTSIGSYAFYSCTSLKSVTIGNGLTSIAERMFQGCSKLASVTLSKSVTSIGGNAFWNCTALADIHYDGTKAQWKSIKKESSSWNPSANDFTVHCSDGNLDNKWNDIA